MLQQQYQKTPTVLVSVTVYIGQYQYLVTVGIEKYRYWRSLLLARIDVIMDEIEVGFD